MFPSSSSPCRGAGALLSVLKITLSLPPCRSLSSGFLLSFPPSLLRYFPLLFSPRVLSIYREKMEQVCLLLMRLQSRNGWSAIDAFGGGGGEEKREGFLNKNVSCYSSFGGKMNSVVQNDTVLVFLYIYMK